MMDDYHQVIHDAVKAHSAKLGRQIDYIEIGVLTGNSAEAVLSTQKVRQAVLVDSFSDPQYSSWQSSAQSVEARLVGYKGNFEIMAGDSKSVLPRIQDSYEFDVGFVDGDHTESGCDTDLRNMLPMIRSGGIMFVDDMTYPGLSGVVERFAKENSLEFSYHAVHNGLGELHKP